jgi:hypothetical protein
VCVCVCVCVCAINLVWAFSRPRVLSPSWIAGIPIHHSLPGAANVIYLDFDGMDVVGTVWNANYGGGTFQATAFDSDNDFTSFSASERVLVSRVWNRVAEDFAPFNVDVTTEPPARFGPTTAMVLITRSVDKVGRPMPESSFAGFAYIDVFGSLSLQL